jgi:hypothetical protein
VARREDDAEGGADHASEHDTPSLAHAGTIATLAAEHQVAVGHAHPDRVALGERAAEQLP